MTNEQVNAARKVASQFPTLRIEATEMQITPYNGETAGATVTVLETTSPNTVKSELHAACVALVNG